MGMLCSVFYAIQIVDRVIRDKKTAHRNLRAVWLDLIDFNETQLEFDYKFAQAH